MVTVTDTEVTNNADLVQMEGRDRITGPALFCSLRNLCVLCVSAVKKTKNTCKPQRRRERRGCAEKGSCIFLDSYMPFEAYSARGICIRDHCGAEPPCDIESFGFVGTV